MPAAYAKTISEYINSAPKTGQDHLRRIYKILKDAAPHAEDVIKWGTPFFVEPRFLFGFSATKAHLNFAPTPDALDRFRKDIGKLKTTKNYLQVPYSEPFPEDLIRKIAEYRVKVVSERKDDNFWDPLT